MSKIACFAACLLFCGSALCAFAAVPAHSPFDGTWRTDLGKTKFSHTPLSFYIGNGWYHCVTCNPGIDIQADGEDHPLTGQAYDSMSIKIDDPHTITVIAKKDGKVAYEQTRSVSADGKVLTVKMTIHPMDGSQLMNFEATARRSGIAPLGVHATSGQWVIEKESASANGLIATYKTNGDEITMTTPDGESYTAKLDGNDYPVKGAYGWDTVSLKQINPHTLEETDKRGGVVIDVSKITVEGNTMTVVDTDTRTNRTSTYVAHKQ